MYGTLERSANVHVENSVYKAQFLNSFKQKMNTETKENLNTITESKNKQKCLHTFSAQH